jgi:hypothetical protein
MPRAVKHRPKLIHHIYFSCGRHFEFLLRSVRSLVALDSAFTGKIYIYVDRDDCFTQEQLRRLTECSWALVLRKSQTVHGYGRTTINVEIPCLRDVAMENDPQSFVAKTDSDIIFISDHIFEAVTSSAAGIAGEAVQNFHPFLFTSGGCYFLNNQAGRNLTEMSEAFYEEVLGSLNEVNVRRGRQPEGAIGEDVAIYNLVTKKMGYKSLFLANYRESVLHFSGTKEEMFRYDSKPLFYIRYKYIPLFRKVLRKPYRAIVGYPSRTPK